MEKISREQVELVIGTLIKAAKCDERELLVRILTVLHDNGSYQTIAKDIAAWQANQDKRSEARAERRAAKK